MELETRKEISFIKLSEKRFIMIFKDGFVGYLIIGDDTVLFEVE